MHKVVMNFTKQFHMRCDHQAKPKKESQKIGTPKVLPVEKRGLRNENDEGGDGRATQADTASFLSSTSMKSKSGENASPPPAINKDIRHIPARDADCWPVAGPS